MDVERERVMEQNAIFRMASSSKPVLGVAAMMMIEEGLIDPSRMLSVGIRGPLNTAADLDDARGLGIEVVTCQDYWMGDGIERLQAFLERIGDAETYVSFDIDCVDPAYAPGTGTPVCGGFSSTEAMALLRALEGIHLVGADVVEVLPDRDPAGITTLLAAQLLLEILALAAVRG